MTEKRFKLEVSDDWWRVIDNGVTLWKEEVVCLLNEQEERIKELEEENGSLKKENKLKEDFRSFINEDIVQIKEENQRLIKMLDNVANYMQKQHKDTPIDDFVEWWNNIATEGL